MPSPEEIHRHGVDAGVKAACHGDFVDHERAEKVQASKLVKLA